MKAVLYAPPTYWLFDKETLSELVNGCGPGGWKNQYVPNTVYGLSIKEACDIHDFMYLYGESEADREEADRVFLNNMNRIISDARERSSIVIFRDILFKLRKLRIKKYYLAVKYFGGPAFWKDKNNHQSMRAACIWSATE